MIVVITHEAESDLEQIGDHIAKDNSHRAVTFVRELREKCAALLNPDEKAIFIRV